MNKQEVIDMWEEDAVIDKLNLDHESVVRTPKLHHKWYTILMGEKATLRKLETDLKRLKHAKTQFYMHGPDESHRGLDWKMPRQGKIIKAEVSTWVDVDKDVIKQADLVAHQVDLVEAINEIVKSLNFRGNNIKNAIEFIKFKQGI